MSALCVLFGGRAAALVVGTAMALAAWGASDLWWRAEFESLRAACAQERTRALRAEAAATAEAIAAIERWADIVTQEAAVAVRASAARAARLERTLQEVRDARPEDDAPLAPVLRHALDGLRGAGG